MSTQRIEYDAGAEAATEVLVNLAPCSECGHALSFWKVERINDCELTLRCRCNACCYSCSILVVLVLGD